MTKYVEVLSFAHAEYHCIICSWFTAAYSADVDEVGNDDNITIYFVEEVTASDRDEEGTPNSQIKYNITDVFVTDSVRPFTDVRIVIVELHCLCVTTNYNPFC